MAAKWPARLPRLRNQGPRPRRPFGQYLGLCGRFHSLAAGQPLAAQHPPGRHRRRIGAQDSRAEAQAQDARTSENRGPLVVVEAAFGADEEPDAEVAEAEAEVLRAVRRKSLAKLRKEIEPADLASLGALADFIAGHVAED